MTYRIRNIAIAVALALTAALLTTFYVSNYKRNVQQGEANVQVWVASQDIPAGLTGAAAVKRHLLAPQDIARRNVVPGAISQPDQIEKLLVTQRVYAGEQVTLRRFGAQTQQGLRGRLTGTLRAVQVSGDTDQLLAGTLRTGDHVDVVAYLTGPQGDYSRIVVRDVEVLKAADGPKVNDRVGAPSGSVLLALRDTQVQRFWFAVENDKWSLELRPPSDAADSREVVEIADSVFNGRPRRQP